MTEDLKRTLDRAVSWYRPAEADPAEAIRRAGRRHHRRQGSAIVLALLLSTGAATVLYRAFSGPQTPARPIGPPPEPRTSLLTPGVRITTPGDWTLIDLWPMVGRPGRCPDFSSDRPSCLPAGQPVLQLSNRDQGLSANLCSKARPLAPADLAVLYVGYDVAALSQASLVRPWPVSLQPVDGTACSVRGAGQNYAARWVASDGTPYLAFAYLGQSASSADRDALFTAFDGMSFEPAQIRESGLDQPAYVIASGTDRGRPWNLETALVGGGPELILDLHQPGLGGSLADIRMEDLLKGMAPAGLQDGTMAWGAVSPEVARVQARGANGQTAEGEIVPLPPSMSAGFSAFVVSMPDPTDTTLVAYDSAGATIDEVPFKTTPTTAACPDPASLSMPPAPPIPAPTAENVQTWLRNALAAARTIRADCGDYSTVAPQTLARIEPTIAYDTAMNASPGIVSVRDVAPEHLLLVSEDADGSPWCLADALATGTTDYGRTDARTAERCSGGWGPVSTLSFEDVVFRAGRMTVSGPCTSRRSPVGRVAGCSR